MTLSTYANILTHPFKLQRQPRASLAQIKAADCVSACLGQLAKKRSARDLYAARAREVTFSGEQEYQSARPN